MRTPRQARLIVESLEERRVLSTGLGSLLGALAPAVADAPALVTQATSNGPETPALPVLAPASQLVSMLSTTVSSIVIETTSLVTNVTNDVTASLPGPLAAPVSNLVASLSSSVSSIITETMSVVTNVASDGTASLLNPVSSVVSSVVVETTSVLTDVPTVITSLPPAVTVPLTSPIQALPLPASSNSAPAVGASAGNVVSQVPVLATATGNQVPSTVNVQNATGLVAAPGNGVVAAPATLQPGLVAYPVFATGLLIANPALNPPPATGFGDNLTTRPDNLGDHSSLRGLDVPSLQFYDLMNWGAPGAESDVGDQELNNRSPGAWDDSDQPLLPYGADLLGAALPAGTGAVDQGIRQFLDGLEDIGLALAQALAQNGLLPWAVGAVMVGAVAVEVTRPRLRRLLRRRIVAAGAAGDSMSWVPGLPGSFSIDEP